jgi:putative ABC transport system permease protein
MHPYIWILGPVSGAIFVSVIGYLMVANTMRKNTHGLLRALG